ncbi:Cd2+/Zn2+-exporting ATPase [Rhizobium tibeticum]|uniref:Cd2+/Zn2+-exporting ATPase n=1 Tax=Rhizobium tibeticum TaxID=501024 RepID=A0A1H8T5B8_9HYPH|nr:Lead, cadmium, zinc and mercury-transporting ATPase [Rhizobium tibeticum]SEO86157.1 Cd2+/Zn2+-exporting ATPase [Rhizobium tibeticum]
MIKVEQSAFPHEHFLFKVSVHRETIGNIWQNIGLALGLKAIFLVTTLTGVTTLWMAILADTGATVLVTANALRLLTYRSKK